MSPRSIEEKEYIDNLKRDMADLLNTRRPYFARSEYDRPSSSLSSEDPLYKPFPEADETLLCYGVRDFSGLTFNGNNSGLPQRIGLEIKKALLAFEKRLTDVEVTLREQKRPGEAPAAQKSGRPQLCYVIACRVNFDPFPIQLQFTTTLNESTCQFEIQERRQR